MAADTSGLANADWSGLPVFAFVFQLWVAQVVLALFAGVLYAGLRANGERPRAARVVGRTAAGAGVLALVTATPWFAGVTWAFWGPTWPLLGLLLVVGPLATLAVLVWGVWRYAAGPAEPAVA